MSIEGAVGALFETVRVLLFTVEPELVPSEGVTRTWIVCPFTNRVDESV
jgi:hypothetical protein